MGGPGLYQWGIQNKIKTNESGKICEETKDRTQEILLHVIFF
jgi:hypothetical protein